MTAPGWIRVRRVRVAGGLAALAVLVTGCGPQQGGSARATPASERVATITATSTPTVPAARSTTSTEVAPTGVVATIEPGTAGADMTAPATAVPGVAGATADAMESPPSGAPWSAVVETGPGAGIPSPTGDLSADLRGDRVCFVPVTGAERCDSLAAGALPTFAVFAQDGEHLLVVAGPANASVAYVLDVTEGSTRVVGPDGVRDYRPGAAPPTWDLSSAAWGADGTTVLLVPRTPEPAGAILVFDLDSGAVAAPIRLDAALANNSPSLWTTGSGIAVVANAGPQINALWWGDFATGTVRKIADFPDPGGSLLLGGADPTGTIVLVCPRRADGQLGATVGVAVDGSRTARILPDSTSCAGSVFSPGGQYLAMAAVVDGDYVVLIADRITGNTVLSVPLLFESAPPAPPYLTWLGDVLVAADVTGEWSVPSLVVRLQR